MTKVTQEEFDEMVDAKAQERAAEMAEEAACDAVTSIFKEPDDEASEAAREAAKALDGELEGRVNDALDKALKKKQDAKKGGSTQERIALMSGLGDETGNKVFDEPVEKRLSDHWLVQKGHYNGHKIGSGKLAADMMFYCFRSFEERGGLDWGYIRSEAKRNGSKQVERVVDKNLQDTDFSQGGALIPPEFAGDLIGFLHGATAVRDIDPVTMELTSELIQSKITGTVTAHFRGEGGTVDSSSLDTGVLRFSENELVIRVIQSRRFVRNAPAGALGMIRDEMRSVAGTKEESVLLRSPGSQNEPTGILNLVNSSNKFDRTQDGSESTVEEISRDLVKMQDKVHSAGKVPRLRPSYVLPETVMNSLKVQHDGDGNLSSLAMMAREGELHGAPARVTNQIPTTQDPNSDSTEAYYIEASQYVIADSTDVEVREYDQATVTDASGQARNLADRGEMAVELCARMDAGLRHDVGASVLEKVDWHSDAF